MWPFSKKDKKTLPKLIKLTNAQVREILLQGRKPCLNKECECNDCLLRGKCGFEFDLYRMGTCMLGGQMSPIVRDVLGLGCGCSVKKALKGGCNEKKEGAGTILSRDTSNGGCVWSISQVLEEGGGDE